MTRLRELGVTIGLLPAGEHNAITDVPGVRVGYTTLIEGDAVRTGVTAIVPHAGRMWERPLFAGCHRLNGAGDFTGLEWVRESGTLTTPVAITNTNAVGIVRDTLIAMEARERPDGQIWFSMPVVAETFDGLLSDIHGFHVRAEHVESAFAAAADGPIAEGNVGGGTGMLCHGFKGGTGTSSRIVETEAGSFTVGVLVQANYGRRERLTVAGVLVGQRIPESEVPLPGPAGGPGGGSRAERAAPRRVTDGSIVVIVATDAPLLPHQCERLAQRAGLGVGRVGGAGENTSGDLFLCFATANAGRVSAEFAADSSPLTTVDVLANRAISPLFYGVIESTEEAIVNALCAAETMTGLRGNTAYALPHDLLVDALGS